MSSRNFSFQAGGGRAWKKCLPARQISTLSYDNALAPVKALPEVVLSHDDFLDTAKAIGTRHFIKMMYVTRGQACKICFNVISKPSDHRATKQQWVFVLFD